MGLSLGIYWGADYLNAWIEIDHLKNGFVKLNFFWFNKIEISMV